MPKYIISEDRINEFVGVLFKMIGKKKGKKMSKILKNDPKLQSFIQRGEKLADETEKHIKKMRKVDPEYDAAAAEVDRFLAR